MEEDQTSEKARARAESQHDVNVQMQFPEDPAVTAHRMHPVSSSTPALHSIAITESAVQDAEADPMASAMGAIAALAKLMDQPFNPNAPETEQDGIRAEALRRLKVRRLFKAPQVVAPGSSSPSSKI